MARMLGANRDAGCGLGRCRHCQKGDETRRFKRREERAFRETIARFQKIAATLPAQEDDGNLDWLVREIEDWAPLRQAATTGLLGEDGG